MRSEFWTQISEVMQHEEEALKSRQKSPVLYLDQVEKWFRRHRKKGDGAIGRWMGSGEWPEMSPELAWHLAMRVHWGWKQAILMSLNDWPAPPSYREAVRWLLVDTWNLCGAAQVESDLKAGVFVPVRRSGEKPPKGRSI